MAHNAAVFFVDHYYAIAWIVGPICIALKVYIVKNCKDHPHYIGKE